MKEVLQFLSKIVDWLRAVCAFFACVYGVLWFFYFFKSPFYTAISVFFNPVADYVRTIINHQFTFDGQKYDATYMVTAVIFIGLFWCATKVYKYLQLKIEDAVFAENLRRARSDIRTNVKISKEFREHISKINHYVICLNLNLKYGVEENLLGGERADLTTLKNKNYQDILENMGDIQNTKVQIHEDKILIIGTNYTGFERVFNLFLDITSVISQENHEKDILTEIFFVIDGIEEGNIDKEKMAFLKKVLSFGYKNKAVASIAFAKRYEQEKNTSFVLSTMGKIRFFEGGLEHSYNDFELFTIKRKRKKEY